MASEGFEKRKRLFEMAGVWNLNLASLYVL